MDMDMEFAPLFFDYLPHFDLRFWLSEFRGIDLIEDLARSNMKVEFLENSLQGAIISIADAGDVYFYPPVFGPVWLPKSESGDEKQIGDSVPSMYKLAKDARFELRYLACRLNFKNFKGYTRIPKKILLSPDKRKLLLRGVGNDDEGNLMKDIQVHLITHKDPGVFRMTYRDYSLGVLDACFSSDSKFLISIPRKEPDTLLFFNICNALDNQVQKDWAKGERSRRGDSLHMLFDKNEVLDDLQGFLSGKLEDPEEKLGLIDYKRNPKKNPGPGHKKNLTKTGYHTRVIDPLVVITPEREGDVRSRTTYTNLVSASAEVPDFDGPWRIAAWHRDLPLLSLYDLTICMGEEEEKIKGDFVRVNIGTLLKGSLDTKSEKRPFILDVYLPLTDEYVLLLCYIPNFRIFEMRGVGILLMVPTDKEEAKYKMTWFHLSDKKTALARGTFIGNLQVDASTKVIWGGIERYYAFCIDVAANVIRIADTKDKEGLSWYHRNLDFCQRLCFVHNGGILVLNDNPTLLNSASSVYGATKWSLYRKGNIEEEVKKGFGLGVMGPGDKGFETKDLFFDIAVGANLFSCGYCGRPLFVPLVCGRCREVAYCGLPCQKADFKDHDVVCGSLLKEQMVHAQIL